MSSRYMSTEQNPIASSVSSYPQTCAHLFCRSHRMITGARLIGAERYRISGARRRIKSSGKSTRIDTTLSPRLSKHKVIHFDRIFWVVSVPLAILLMIYFFTSWPTKVNDRWKAYQRRHDESPAPAYMHRPTPENVKSSMRERLKFRMKRAGLSHVGSD